MYNISSIFLGNFCQTEFQILPCFVFKLTWGPSVIMCCTGRLSFLWSNAIIHSFIHSFHQSFIFSNHFNMAWMAVNQEPMPGILDTRITSLVIQVSFFFGMFGMFLYNVRSICLTFVICGVPTKMSLHGKK